MKFCLPALRVLMGRTEGKNDSFENSSKFFFFHDLLVYLIKKVPEAKPKFMIVMWICGIFTTIIVLPCTH